MASEAGKSGLFEKNMTKVGDWITKGKTAIAGKVDTFKGKTAAVGKDVSAATAVKTGAATAVLEGKAENVAAAAGKAAKGAAFNWKSGFVVVPVTLVGAACVGGYWFLTPKQKDSLLKTLRIKQ